MCGHCDGPHASRDCAAIARIQTSERYAEAKATRRPRPNRAAVGPRDCHDCGAVAYTHHAPSCSK